MHPRDIEAQIVASAARQHGVVTRGQLLAAGVSGGAIDVRLRTGRLRRIHRGVYAPGVLDGKLAPAHAREMAAVLACGPGAVVSHRSAASLWEIHPPPGREKPVDVTVPAVTRRRRPGIRTHRSALAPRSWTRLAGIPVTTPARTLRDLASEVTARELNRAAARAERRGLVTEPDIRSLTRECRGRRGAPLLRAALPDDGPLVFTRSVAEERFLALVGDGRLAQPEVNVVVADREVDFLWRSERLAVEVDGFRHHGSRRSFETDRRRDAELTAAGIRVLRFTWRQITEEPSATLVRLAQALARTAPSA